MRLAPLLRGARTPQNENKVPFQAILPLSLRDKVSGKGDKTSDVSCLQEMAVLFACLKNHDFSEQLCGKEIQEFKSCYKKSTEKKHQRQELEAKGGIGASAATATPVTINKVLRRFPLKSK